MREILFRGKLIDVDGKIIKDRDFIHGYYRKQSNGHIIYQETDVVCGSEVDPETIGQYTGIDDINGNKIFDGDIIDIDGIKAVMVWSLGRKWELESVNKNELENYIRNDGVDNISNALWDCSITVIGNIHDNPELL